MAFTIMHKINRLISTQYFYLCRIIESYSPLIKEWQTQEELECQKIAKEDSEGDPEIESSMLSQMYGYMEYIDSLEPIFNNSMLLMTFSYFEGIINRIASEENIEFLTKKGKIRIVHANEIINELVKRNRIIKTN